MSAPIPAWRRRELADREMADESRRLGIVLGDALDEDIQRITSDDVYCVLCRDDVPAHTAIMTGRGGMMCRRHKGTPEGDQELRA